MKASDYLAEFLAAREVPAVFEMSGGMITHLLDSIGRLGRTRIVSVHHEQAAAFAADAAGRISGIPGVALATSGPGATNLLTGVGSCYFDSAPAVFITGQVNRHEQKGDRPIRQLGFQETDIVSMARPITKAAWQVCQVEDLPDALEKAFALAGGGRPGPVLLDLPMDIQRAQITSGDLKPMVAPAAPESAGRAGFLDELFRCVAAATRPLILVGGGIRSAGAAKLFRELLSVIRIPTVYSLMGVDVLPYGDPFRVGMIGSYGNRWANLAIGQSDLLIVLGSRLDIRQTGSDTANFKGRRTVFHVDCDEGELNNRLVGCHVLHEQLAPFLAGAIQEAKARNLPNQAGWMSEINQLRKKWPDTEELDSIQGVNPNSFLHELSRVSAPALGFVVDVGQHQMWAAQSLELHPRQRFLTSGGMGSMGFALPAAIGASHAANQAPMVVIAGDGGFQANIQELQTVVRDKLPLKIVVINNQCHGMVRQFQESYFEARYQSTLWGYSAPDFTRVAEAYGIPARSITDATETEDSLAWLWQNSPGPSLLQVMVDTHANAYPKIAFGRPMTEMEPFATPLEMEGT